MIAHTKWSRKYHGAGKRRDLWDPLPTPHRSGNPIVDLHKAQIHHLSVFYGRTWIKLFTKIRNELVRGTGGSLKCSMCVHCTSGLMHGRRYYYWNSFLPGSSVHGICQARILEWVAISFSRGSFQPRAWTWVSCIAGRFLTNWVMTEGL